MNHQEIVTSVSAEGSAEAEFDTARFSVKAEARGKTGPDAKKALKEEASKLRSLYDAFEAEGYAEKIRTSVSVNPDYDYKSRTRKIVGYVASYSMSFRTTSLDKVSAIHDALTKIDNVAVHPPTFDVKDKSELSKLALKSAFSKCQDRFESECVILGKDPKQFEVGTWNVSYSEDNYRQPVRALSAMAEAPMGGGNEEAIAIESGKAEVTVRFQAHYVRKR